jgi:CubicO group peptidase (beta-lactamase class C family)
MFGRSNLTVAVVVFCGASFGAFASSTPSKLPHDATGSAKQKVDELFAPWSEPEHPGCAVGVLRDGKMLYSRGYGLADIEHDAAITPATAFHVASVSKQFTAMAIYLLAQDGKLSLDDDARKYLPELHDFGRTITIRHLLHHTSGIRDQWDLLLLAGWRLGDVITEQDILDLVWRQKELNFVPGEEHMYSNTGYTLLGVIVHRVSGKTLREFTDERMFKPLGMTHTHFHEQYGSLVKGRAYSYIPLPDAGQDKYRSIALSYSNVGATSLFTTVEDLARWDENFYTGQVGGKTLLGSMQVKGVLNDGSEIAYASGLAIGDYRGAKVVEHSGMDAGFRAQLLRFPDQHFSTIVLCNAGEANPWLLSRDVADIYLATELEPVTEVKVEVPDAKVERAHPSQERLQAYAGTYFSNELNTVYLVSTRNGKLFARHPRGELELEPIKEDEFAMPEVGVVKFKCVTVTRCNSFAVTTERVRDLRLDKVDLSASDAR